MGKSYNGADNIAIISPESSTNLCSILSITSQEYADFLVKHANELDPYLILIKPSEIRGDEEYVCKVLRMIVNQSIKLDKEIENMASMYQMEVDKLKEVIGEEEKKQIGLDLAVQKAVEIVTEAAVEK
mgnify:CR=1 FL=1